MTEAPIKNEPLFSIVIPITVINDYLAENCEKLKKLKNQNFELIIISDEKTSELENLITGMNGRIIAAGNISPALKRDMGVRESKGKYIAFIDDDAYPKEDWLDIAEKYLSRAEISALGGPQITPPQNTFWQKVSGAMFLSPLSGMAIRRYFPYRKPCFVDDWPTVNFFVKKSVFEESGGFDSKFWPGEDTKLCLDIIKKLKKKILYLPELQVFHHRREGLGKHLKQTGGYGLHRGYFAKVFPETSARFKTLYFVPSLWTIFLFFGPLFYFASPVFLKFYFFGIGIYLFSILISSFVIWKRTESVLVTLVSIPYLLLFHIWYGIRFIQGLIFTKELKSRLGR